MVTGVGGRRRPTRLGPGDGQRDRGPVTRHTQPHHSASILAGARCPSSELEVEFWPSMGQLLGEGTARQTADPAGSAGWLLVVELPGEKKSTFSSQYQFICLSD